MLAYYTVGLLLLCACVFYHNCREPFDGSPMEYTQSQAGRKGGSQAGAHTRARAHALRDAH